jgi:hypothetical protein
LIGFRIFLSTPSHSVGIYKLNPGISSYLTWFKYPEWILSRIVLVI